MIRQLLMGIVIGIANIVPGVSGGTMAVSMGIYDKLIFAVTHIKSDFKNSVKLLLPIAIGCVLSVVGIARVIEVLFLRYPMPANCLFIGLILGGLPAVFAKVKTKRVTVGKLIVCVLFFALIVGMTLLGEQESAAADLSLGWLNGFKLFGIGIVASATMVIPGVSGSMILMLMGYYTPLIQCINAFVEAVVSWDTAGIGAGLGVLIPLGVGVLVGIVVIAKLVELIFRKFAAYAYYAIMGLIVASPFSILMAADFGTVSLAALLGSVGMLAVGYVAAYKLGEK